jgi:protein gp37
MSDVFHEEAPIEAIAQLWSAFASEPAVRWLVLTKRPERMLEVLTSPDFLASYAECNENAGLRPCGLPLPNVWLGVTIENRRFVHRADLLRQTPSAVRFISAEPLLGPLVLDGVAPDPEGGVIRHWKDHKPQFYNPPLDLTSIDWLIVGGESGKGHRRFDPDWARDLRNACTQPRESGERGTAFFFKQHGGKKAKEGGRILDGRTWDEFPRPETISASSV